VYKYPTAPIAKTLGAGVERHTANKQENYQSQTEKAMTLSWNEIKDRAIKFSKECT
jgi:hypothetical protein